MTEALCSCYGERMDLQQNPKIQHAIDVHLATGKYVSAEEVILVALQHLADDEAEYESAVRDLQESLADEGSGRIKPLSRVAADIRQKHGFSDPV